MISTGPRIYRPSLTWRALLLGFGSIMTVFSVASLVHFGTGHETKGPADVIRMVVLLALFAAFSGYVLWVGLRFRVVLHADAIEFTALGPTRRMQRDDIAGYRIVQTQYFRQLTLLPRWPHLKRIDLPLWFTTDAAFDAWLAGIVDREAEDRDRNEATLRAELASSTDDHTAQLRLQRARSLAKGLNVAGVVAALALFQSPNLFVLGVCAILPWVAVAVVIASRGLVRLDARRNDAHPQVSFLLTVPALALGYVTVRQIELADPRVLLLPALGGATVIGALLLAFARPLRALLPQSLIVLPVGAVVLASVLAQANVRLDQATPEVHAVQVLDKQIAHGWTDTVSLVLSWSPRGGTAITVPRSLWNATAPGGTVRVVLYPGALGWSWFYVTLP